MMRPQQFLSAVLLVAPLAGAAAQTTVQDISAFVALRSTHIGALTPMLSPVMVGQQLRSAQLGIRYGFQRESNVTTHAIAGSGVFAAGTSSSVAIHAGVSDADCGDCAPEMMLGVGGEMRVFEIGDALGAGSALHVGVSGDIGYAQLKGLGLTNETRGALALGIGAPLALSMSGSGGTGMRIVPFMTPALGIGQISGCGGSETCNGTRFVLGGGLALRNPMSSISASLGINHVFLEGQDPVFGVNVVIGGR